MNATFNLVMDIIGTIAFAISGVMVASKKKMDLFGINILALCTAVGGGMVRDVLIGVTPPVMFRNPIFVIIALVTANLTILRLYFHKKTIHIPSVKQNVFHGLEPQACRLESRKDLPSREQSCLFLGL